MNKIILLVVGVVLTSFSFKSPTDTYIRGQVTDITNGNPIAFANVRLRGSAITKRTDANGYYCVQIKDAGVLEFSASSYYGKNRKVATDDNPVDMQLQPIPVKPVPVKAPVDTIRS